MKVYELIIYLILLLGALFQYFVDCGKHYCVECDIEYKWTFKELKLKKCPDCNSNLIEPVGSKFHRFILLGYIILISLSCILELIFNK